jgi:integrase
MLRTKSGLPKHCCWNTDRHGKRRVRFRKAGFTTYLTGTPWSEDFMRQYAAALDGIPTQTGNIGEARTLPGTFNALCVRYYRSPDFLGLAPRIQQQRRNVLENFRAAHGNKPLKGLHRHHIKDILGAKANTPEAANHLLKVLRGILAFAVDQNMVATNPAVGVKKYRTHTDGHHSWTDQEIAQFQARHPAGTKAGLALALGLYTAQRKGDVLRMGWQHVSVDTITVRQEKTKTPLMLPMHPELKAALANVPRTNLTFLLTEWGKPFDSGGFGNWFRYRCNEAGLRHCTFHGLRKAAATRLTNAGCSTDEVRAITGHRSLAEVAHYTKAADQQRLAQQALAKQLRAEGEQKLSNPAPRLDKTAAK